MKELLLPVTVALLAATVPAVAAQPGAGPAAASAEVRIPFPAYGAVRNFRPDGDSVVYFEGRRRQWYRAQLDGPCLNLFAAQRLGFDTRHGNYLDNTTTLVVGGERCRIVSLIRAESPPPRRRPLG